MADECTKILERNPTAVRLPEDLLNRAEDLLDHWSKLNQDLIKKLGGRRSRSTILRLAIQYGIEKLEADVGSEKPTSTLLMEILAPEPQPSATDLEPMPGSIELLYDRNVEPDEAG